MDLTWTAEERAFRTDVQTFLQAKLPADLRATTFAHQRLKREDYIRWHRILADQGWGAPTWPKEYGGTGWNPLQRLIFEVESFKAGAPRLVPFGISMIGPVLMKFGSPAQKAHYLPRIIRMDDWWCQGYSEPGSGSDLASLSTRAERVGDHYIVNGQKTWTTMAQHADWMFCLVRTDPQAKAQRGISLVLFDMRQPGVTVRPIRTLDGGAEVNEVWLENVKVTADNLVGEENNGWTYAKYLLGHERTGIAGLGHCHRELAILKGMAERASSSGESLSLDPRVRDSINRIEAQVLALEMLLLRVAADASAEPGPQASILKIRGSEIQQDLARLQMQVAGPDAWPYDPEWMLAESAFHGPGPEYSAASAAGYFDMRKTSIYGGTTEVQKGIIAKQMIGV
ncbi:MAG: acyl-CoA dehydrogenase family protein [Burkholderiales bacterium]